jgi:hypothetical protein
MFDVAINPPKTSFSGGLQVSLGKLRTEDYGVHTQTPVATPFTPLRSGSEGGVMFRRLWFVRMQRHGRKCSLFSFEPQSSKLLVASSILVFRSIL